MKNISVQTLLLAFTILISLSSCEIVGGIFKAGFWSAIILIILVIVIIGVIIKKFMG